MSPQAQSVLNVLRAWPTYGITTERIAYELNTPQPSVRRALGELLKAGYTFERTGRSIRIVNTVAS